MEAMTVSVLWHQRHKVEARLDKARRMHGTEGRGGGVVDTTELVAKLERELSDWVRLITYAQNH